MILGLNFEWYNSSNRDDGSGIYTYMYFHKSKAERKHLLQTRKTLAMVETMDW